MKRLFFLATLLAAIIASAVSATAQTTNPVDDFVNNINGAKESIANATSLEQVETIGKSTDKFFDQYKNSTYTLTDADREKITDALTSFTIVTATKAAQLQNQEVSPEEIQSMEPMFRSQLTTVLAKTTTLGDVFSSFFR